MPAALTSTTIVAQVAKGMKLPHQGYWIYVNSCFHSVSKNDIETLVMAEQKLSCILKSELIYAVALEGYHELHALSRQILEEQSGFAVTEISHIQKQVLVNLKAMAALTSIKSYTDMFKTYLDRVHPEAGKSYKSEIEGKLHSDKLFCLASLIRNFSQHWDFPVTTQRYSGCRSKGIAKWMPIFSISEALDSNKRFEKDLRRYGHFEALKIEGEINLLDAIEHVLRQLSSLHVNYKLAHLEPNLESSVAEVNCILRSRNSHFDAETGIISFSDKEVSSIQDERPFVISPSIRSIYYDVAKQNCDRTEWDKIERPIEHL